MSSLTTFFRFQKLQNFHFNSNILRSIAVLDIRFFLQNLLAYFSWKCRTYQGMKLETRSRGMKYLIFFKRYEKLYYCFHHKISDFFDTCNSYERIFLLYNQALFEGRIWKLQISDDGFRYFRNLLCLHWNPGYACEFLKLFFKDKYIFLNLSNHDYPNVWLKI